MTFSNKVVQLRRTLGISTSVARELLLLAGEDVDIVIQASEAASGLNECKARVIDLRFNKLEGGE